jgi:hypothetical protein
MDIYIEQIVNHYLPFISNHSEPCSKIAHDRLASGLIRLWDKYALGLIMEFNWSSNLETSKIHSFA